VEQSILKSVKKVLGLAEDYDAFDQDVLMHINTTLSTLNQLGVGPSTGLFVDDGTATWNDLFNGDNRYNLIRTYVYLKVRALFDPPTVASMATALDANAKELEWRISAIRESDIYSTGETPELPSGVLDGGGP
jgi:hypothetical protein